MLPKLLYFLLAFTIILQLIFSFYFSNETINQSLEYQDNTQKVFVLKQNIEKLENQYSSSVSINNLSRIATASSFMPIVKSINLNNSPTP